MTGRKKSGEGKELLMTQSIPHHVSNMLEADLFHRHAMVHMASKQIEDISYVLHAMNRAAVNVITMD